RPGLAVDEVNDAAGHRVTDVGSIDEREHHREERYALLRVEAAVDRINQHERVIGAEVAQPNLFGQDRESLPFCRELLELSEDGGLGGAIELHRAVAAGPDGQL